MKYGVFIVSGNPWCYTTISIHLPNFTILAPEPQRRTYIPTLFITFLLNSWKVTCTHIAWQLRSFYTPNNLKGYVVLASLNHIRTLQRWHFYTNPCFSFSSFPWPHMQENSFKAFVSVSLSLPRLHGKCIFCSFF